MDKYWVYRPLLDLIGLSEGTDWNAARKRGRGYNETLAYGAYTGGEVDLVSMSLAEIDDLQTKMLTHKANKWNSSAIGRYQIVRTTMRQIIKTLKLDKSLRYDAAMQDRMACYLLGLRGIDKWLSGRLSLDTLINNLAKEWASLPTTTGKGHYSGQNSSVTLTQVRRALEQVRQRHLQGQPVPPKAKDEITESVKEAEAEVKKETGIWGWLTTLIGSVGAGLAWLADRDIDTVLVLGGVGCAGLLVLTFLGPRLAKSLREIRETLA